MLSRGICKQNECHFNFFSLSRLPRFLVCCYCEYFLFRNIPCIYRRLFDGKEYQIFLWRKKKCLRSSWKDSEPHPIQGNLSTLHNVLSSALCIPFLSLSPTKFSFLMLILQEKPTGLLGGGGRTTGSVQKGMASGHDAILPNIRGEPSIGGASVLHEPGSPSLFLNPLRLPLLPRYFKKHHLKLEGI